MGYQWILLLIAAYTWLAPLAAAMPLHMGAGRPRSATDDPYNLRIVSYYQDNGRTALVLSNGSIWRLQSPVLWLADDSVYLTSLPHGQWSLYNSNDHSSAVVQFIRLTAEGTRRIKGVENGGGSIILDDGSQWQVDRWQRLWGHSWSWQVGDRILIAPLQLLLYDHTHLLIDIDRSWRHLEAIRGSN